jgi:hypothetical protein
MAASGYTPIQLYRTSTSGTAPTAGNLIAGELAINYNTADMSVWALNTGGSVIRLMNNPAGLKYPTVDGTVNQALVTNGSAVLSWASFLPLAGGTMTGSVTLVTPVLGTPSSGTLSSCTVDGTNAVGYRRIPQSASDKITAYTLASTDVGKYIGVGTSGSIVVPSTTYSDSVAVANGDAISIFNNTTGNITITTSAPTAYIAGTNTVKTSITLVTRGIATILFVSATVCVVSGNVL